jgi:cystathionine beta-lyase
MFTSIDRSNTNAIKWELYKDKGLLPMWVADMDLASPGPIREALIERISHPVYGYTHPWQSLNESVVEWCEAHYHWDIEADWIVWMPGVVPSFNLACDLLGQGGRVIVQTPNYPPMLDAPRLQNCQPIELPVLWDEALRHWLWDWSTLEAELADDECHLLLLCNPMNPNGSVIAEDDLKKLVSLCNQYGVQLCSDEIHCDLILDGSSHIPMGSIPEAVDSSITLMAASKTFNIAGFGCSFAVIPNESLRRRWGRRMKDLIPHPSFVGMIATEVAFRECEEWRQELLVHLLSNQQLISDRLNKLEGICYRPQPATYLAWIESTRKGLNLSEHFISAGVMPSKGRFFGDPEHARLNFGTGRETLEQGLQLIESYWEKTF